MVGEAGGLESQSIRTDRRREISRRRRDPKKQRIAFALIGLFIVAVIGAFVAAYVINFVLPSRQLVVRVGELEYTRGDMMKLLRIRQKGSEYLGGQFNASADILQTLQLIVENAVISQASPRLGINVTNEEVEAEIRRLLADTYSSAGKLSGQIEREFQERYKSYLNFIQVSRGDHFELIRETLLRERFRQFIGESVPTVAEQVHLHRIVMLPSDKIDIMQVKYKDTIGDSREPANLQEGFKQITREFSREDPSIIRKGGDLGWVPRGIYDDYDYRFFDRDVGEMTDAVPNVDNPNELVFFMVSERAEARELDPKNRDTLKTRALQDWLNEERSRSDVYAVFNSDIYNWMVEQLSLTSSRTPEPELDPFRNLLR